MTETVTWLHISDTHFCEKKHGSESREIIDKFFEDLKWMENKYNLCPDLIFFTGDLALGQIGDSSGLSLKDQYEEVKAFLERIQRTFPKVQKSNIFIVPGNHDVNRSLIMPEQTLWLDSLRNDREKDGSKIINELIKNNTLQWKWYMERLNDYKGFLVNSDYKHLLDDPDRLIYSIIRDINGFKIGIAGLNSAWSSCGDEDKAKLWLGIFQISEARNKLKDTDLSIAISHHPPNWFTDFEDQPIDKKIERNFHFYLHGHEHQGWVKAINKHTRIASGALYNGSQMGNVYNFVKLYPSENRGDVYLRTFNGDRWTHHPVGDADNDGIWHLNSLNVNMGNPGSTAFSNKETSTCSFPSDSFNKNLSASMQIPQIKNFVGRNTELSDLFNLLEKNVIIIEGIAGIGKTYLASRFAEEISNEYEVCWYGDLSESTSIGSLMNQMALYLLSKGRPTLYNSIEMIGYNLDNSINIFKEELQNGKFAIFFDNFHKAESKLNPLIEKLLDIKSSKIILITRVKPSVYNILDEVENRMGRRTLGGWSYEDSRDMFKSRGILVPEEAVIKEIHSRLSGYPQYLNLFCILALKSEPQELLEKLPRAERASHEYLEEAVYNSLESDEKALIKIASVYRIPEKIDAFYIDTDLSNIDEIIEGLISKFLINEVGDEKYSLHEILSDYIRKDPKKRKIIRLYHLSAAQYYKLKDENPESLLEASYHFIESGDKEKSADIIINKAKILIRKGFWEEIVEPLNDAIATLSKYRNNVSISIGIGYAQMLLGELYKEREDVDLALKYLNQSEKSLMGKGDKRALFSLYNQFGNVYNLMGEINNSEKYYKRILQISKDDEYAKAVANANLGNVSAMKGDFKIALENQFTSKISFEKLGDEINVVVTYQNIGEFYSYINEYDNAYICIKEAIKRLQVLGETYYLYRACFTYVKIYLNDPHNKEKLDTVIQHLSKISYAYSKIGYIKGEAKVYLYTALVYDRLNNYQCSVGYCQKARECFEKIDYSNFTTDDRIFLAIIHMYLNDLDKAEIIINDSIKSVSVGNLLSPILKLLLAFILFLKGQETDALRLIETDIKDYMKHNYRYGNFDFFPFYTLIEKLKIGRSDLIKDIIAFIQNKTKYPKISFEQVNIEKEELDNYAEVFHPFIGRKTITKNDESLKIIISKLKSKEEEEVDIDADEVLGIDRNIALMTLGFLYKKGYIKVYESSGNILKMGLLKGAKIKLKTGVKKQT